MFGNTSLVIALLLVASVATGPLQSTPPFELVSIIALEEPCVRQGGLCLRIEDCEPENRVQMHVNLCPQQEHRNVSCCYN